MDSGIESQITASIASTLRVDQTMVRRDSTFAEDLATDSADCAALILAAEAEFGVDIHDEDAAELLTVGQMIEYVALAFAAKTPAITRSDSDGTVGLR
jgi:acyl carrier protein